MKRLRRHPPDAAAPQPSVLRSPYIDLLNKRIREQQQQREEATQELAEQSIRRRIRLEAARIAANGVRERLLTETPETQPKSSKCIRQSLLSLRELGNLNNTASTKSTTRATTSAPASSFTCGKSTRGDDCSSSSALSLSPLDTAAAQIEAHALLFEHLSPAQRITATRFCRDALRLVVLDDNMNTSVNTSTNTNTKVNMDIVDIESGDDSGVVRSPYAAFSRGSAAQIVRAAVLLGQAGECLDACFRSIAPVGHAAGDGGSSGDMDGGNVDNDGGLNRSRKPKALLWAILAVLCDGAQHVAAERLRAQLLSVARRAVDRVSVFPPVRRRNISPEVVLCAKASATGGLESGEVDRPSATGEEDDAPDSIPSVGEGSNLAVPDQRFEFYRPERVENVGVDFNEDEREQRSVDDAGEVALSEGESSEEEVEVDSGRKDSCRWADYDRFPLSLVGRRVGAGSPLEQSTADGALELLARYLLLVDSGCGHVPRHGEIVAWCGRTFNLSRRPHSTVIAEGFLILRQALDVGLINAQKLASFSPLESGSPWSIDELCVARSTATISSGLRSSFLVRCGIRTFEPARSNAEQTCKQPTARSSPITVASCGIEFASLVTHSLVEPYCIHHARDGHEAVFGSSFSRDTTNFLLWKGALRFIETEASNALQLAQSIVWLQNASCDRCTVVAGLLNWFSTISPSRFIASPARFAAIALYLGRSLTCVQQGFDLEALSDPVSRVLNVLHQGLLSIEPGCYNDSSTDGDHGMLVLVPRNGFDGDLVHDLRVSDHTGSIALVVVEAIAHFASMQRSTRIIFTEARTSMDCPQLELAFRITFARNSNWRISFRVEPNVDAVLCQRVGRFPFALSELACFDRQHQAIIYTMAANLVTFGSGHDLDCVQALTGQVAHLWSVLRDSLKNLMEASVGGYELSICRAVCKLLGYLLKLACSNQNNVVAGLSGFLPATVVEFECSICRAIVTANQRCENFIAAVCRTMQIDNRKFDVLFALGDLALCTVHAAENHALHSPCSSSGTTSIECLRRARSLIRTFDVPSGEHSNAGLQLLLKSSGDDWVCRDDAVKDISRLFHSFEQVLPQIIRDVKECCSKAVDAVHTLILQWTPQLAAETSVVLSRCSKSIQILWRGYLQVAVDQCSSDIVAVPHDGEMFISLVDRIGMVVAATALFTQQMAHDAKDVLRTATCELLSTVSSVVEWNELLFSHSLKHGCAAARTDMCHVDELSSLVLKLSNLSPDNSAYRTADKNSGICDAADTSPLVESLRVCIDDSPPPAGKTGDQLAGTVDAESSSAESDMYEFDDYDDLVDPFVDLRQSDFVAGHDGVALPGNTQLFRRAVERDQGGQKPVVIDVAYARVLI